MDLHQMTWRVGMQTSSQWCLWADNAILEDEEEGEEVNKLLNIVKKNKQVF